MLNMNSETFLHKAKVVFNSESIIAIDDNKIRKLKEEGENHISGRCRFCLHHREDESVQEMLLVLPQYTYSQPHYHPDSHELKVIVSGKLLVILYDNDGRERERVIMSSRDDRGSCKLFRIDPGIIHNDIPLSDVCFLEVFEGPYKKESHIVYFEGFPSHMSYQEVQDQFVYPSSE